MNHPYPPFFLKIFKAIKGRTMLLPRWIGLREKYDISRLAPILRKGIGYEEQIELVTLLGKKRKDLYHFLKISIIEKSPSCDIPIYQIHITLSFSLFEKVQTSVLLIL